MRWSPQQDDALVRVDKWLKNGGPQVFRLFGYAGTGKTTLAKTFAEEIDGVALFGAFTGKAAHVMKQKGCTEASTIHSLIYRARPKNGERLEEMKKELKELKQDDPRAIALKTDIEKERSSLKKPSFTLNPDSPVQFADLVIIDECSMVDEKMGSDLLSFGTKVLVLGDPAQLPPIKGGGFFTERVNPDVMLTEVHRQAKDSPVVELATMTREKKEIRVGRYGNTEVLSGVKLEPEIVLGFDQVLVGKNVTRAASNRRYRRLKGFDTPHPEPEDKLVCLRNNHELGLLNGAMFFVDSVESIDDGKILMDIVSEDGGDPISVLAHEHHFIGEADRLEWYERLDANEFDFGYALTVHKSQGSQWDNILLFDESSVFRADKWRWLYTGITRAAEAVTIVKM